MSDQATELRKLVLRSARENAASVGPPPRLVVVSGGKKDVGATTAAVHLSTALAVQGARVVLVDANPIESDVAAYCGVADLKGITDVLASRCDIHEVLARGPSGILVVPGQFATANKVDISEKSQTRLLRQFQLLGRHADVIVVDAGHDATDVARRFWQAANDIIIVTTADAVAIMDSYAAIKTLVAGGQGCSPWLLVNRMSDSSDAEDVHRRIHQSCRRFLGVGLELLGNIPSDDSLSLSRIESDRISSLVSAAAASRAVSRVASRLLSEPPGDQRFAAPREVA